MKTKEFNIPLTRIIALCLCLVLAFPMVVQANPSPQINLGSISTETNYLGSGIDIVVSSGVITITSPGVTLNLTGTTDHAVVIEGTAVVNLTNTTIKPSGSPHLII